MKISLSARPLPCNFASRSFHLIFSRKTQSDASNSVLGTRERFLMLLRDTLLDFHDRLCRARKTNGC
jgi:hypothetical protein